MSKFSEQEVKEILDRLAQHIETKGKSARRDFRPGETDASDGLEWASEIVREWAINFGGAK